MKRSLLKKAKNIKLVIFDVDGVLTDGTLYLTDENVEFKGFHSLDGLGMRILMTSGVEIAIITGRKSNNVKYRMESLGIKHLYQGDLNKARAFDDMLNKLNILESEVAYMGDDVSDLPLMKRAGIAFAPRNAIQEAKKAADYVTNKMGGCGAAREVCDLILNAQGNFAAACHKLLHE